MPNYKASIADNRKLGNYRCSYSCREVLQGRKRNQFNRLTIGLMKKRWLNLTHISDGYYFHDFSDQKKAEMLANIRWIVEAITVGMLERILPEVGSKRDTSKFTVRVTAAKLPSWHQGYVNFLPQLKAILPGEVMNNSFFPSLYLGIVSSVMDQVCAPPYRNIKIPAQGASFEKLLAWAAGSQLVGSPLSGKWKEKLNKFFSTYKVQGYNKLFKKEEDAIKARKGYSYYRVRGFNEWSSSESTRAVEGILEQRAKKTH